jgi:hypothetical protein
MRHWAIAAMVAALLAVSAQAQRRGGMSGGGVGHSGVASHGSMMASRPAGFSGSRHSTQHFSSNFRGPFISPSRFHHRRFFTGFFPYYYGYPYYDDFGNYADNSYMNGPDSYSGYDSSYAQNSVLAQQAEIDRLENEVDRLREEREARSSSASAPRREQGNAQVSDPTTLVFRDQHKEEVQNYAIVDHTVWVFTALRARKIPLSDLDVDATSKVNDERGVEFRVPEQTPE